MWIHKLVGQQSRRSKSLWINNVLNNEMDPRTAEPRTLWVTSLWSHHLMSSRKCESLTMKSQPSNKNQIKPCTNFTIRYFSSSTLTVTIPFPISALIVYCWPLFVYPFPFVYSWLLFVCRFPLNLENSLKSSFSLNLKNAMQSREIVEITSWNHRNHAHSLYHRI